MKILHLASFGRWTGAAAPAFSEVEALREAGHDAHYAYVGGEGLERRIGAQPFAHAILPRSQSPVSTLRAAAKLRRFIIEERVSIVHAHLTHDHWLGRLATRGLQGARLVRTFHSKRTLRRDPITRWLLAGTAGVCVVNATFVSHPAVAARSPLLTPPPVDERVFQPGPDARALYGIEPGVPLLGVIGKIDRERGFEAALDTFSLLLRESPRSRLLIIGRGPLRPTLEARCARLGLAHAVVWAGYHEADLAEHLRAPDGMVFTALGSEEGHRAILEAMACGTPVASYPIYGVESLYGDLAGSLVAPASTPEALAGICARILEGTIGVTPRECVEATSPSRYAAVSARLERFYNSLPA